MPIKQENRLLSLATPLPYNELCIKRLRAFEAISQLFRFQLEIVKEETDENTPPSIKDPTTLVGKSMTVTMSQTEEGESVTRHFNGICASFVQGNRNRMFTKYRAELVPHVWLLTRKYQSRIFQQKNVPDILKKVFEGFEVKFELQGTYEKRNYCVQYRESDFSFASRLMEEEGMFYFFVHSENGHQLVIANTPQSHKPTAKATIPFIADRSGVHDTFQGSVVKWIFDDRIETGKYTLWDNHLELVGKKLEAQEVSRHDIGGNQKLEIYDWPGGYAGRFDGVTPDGGNQASELQKVFEDNKRTVKLRQQELDVAYKTGYGESDCCAIVPGFKFKMSHHQHSGYNTDYILVSAQTEAMQSPWYLSTDEIETPCTVSFVALPLEFGPFRPERRTPVPFVHGSQTATVVGPAGEEIFTDKYGRVKVQFHWDREGQANQASSCWIPVAQTWSGKKWGSMFIPRIGMEVIVDFLEGNPDRPIIVGCVNNAENMPAYTLPDEKTKSYIKTNSSRGSAGFNEIRFEDKKGSEQIFIHGEKNQDIRIKEDCKELIKRDRHLIVERDQFEKVKTDKHLHIGGDHNEKVVGTMSIDVGTDLQEKVGTNYALDAGTEAHIKAGMSVVVEAGTSLTLKVGGNFININSGGIFIKGTMVMLNSGGAAGSGAGCSPEAPKQAIEADNADPGTNPPVPLPPPPLQPVTFGPMATVMKSAASSGAPFCSVCPR